MLSVSHTDIFVHRYSNLYIIYKYIFTYEIVCDVLICFGVQIVEIHFTSLQFDMQYQTILTD